MSLLHIIAEMSRIGSTGGGGTPAPSFDASAQAFFDAVPSLTFTQKNAVNSLVIALKAAGLWNRMVAVYPFVGGTAESHKWNLKNPLDTDVAKRLVFSGTWTHAATGATPNGTNAYANTFLDFNQDVPQYSVHGSYYSRTNTPPGAGDYSLFGGHQTSDSVDFRYYSNNRMYGIAASVDGSLTLFSQANFNKLVGISAWGFNHFNIYRDTVSLGSNTNTRWGYFDSRDPANVKHIYLGAFNDNGTAKYFSSWECAFASFGYGLDTTMWNSLVSIVNIFQTALNRNV